MFNLGWPELLLILIILLLLFGAKKLPEMMRNIGRSAGELKKGMDDVSSSNNKETESTKKKQ